MSEYQKALFLTPTGKPMTDFGLYFRQASMEFTGLHVGERRFRSILTTELHDNMSRSSAEKKLVDKALEHTEHTSRLHYQHSDLMQDAEGWAKLYQLNGV